MCGSATSRVIGVKSRMGSNGRFGCSAGLIVNDAATASSV
jgi:hypothetical protein